VSKPTFYFNVEPLLDSMYTGVALYTFSILQIALDDENINWKAFAYDKLIILSRDELVDQESCRKFLRESLDDSSEKCEVIKSADIKLSTALYFKTVERVLDFGFTAEVLHDLSFLLCPEFHNTATVKHMLPSLNEALLSSDIIFTVSESTKLDLLHYYQLPEEKVYTIYAGPSIKPPCPEPNSEERSKVALQFGKKLNVLLIATIEPRKNHAILFELISSHPWILDFYNFRLVGEEGWGLTLEEIAYNYGLSLDSLKSNVHHFGYVSEEEKLSMLTDADIVFYPSFFEGFGMPVLEGLVFGKPVLCSDTTSLPEVGGDAAFYFDPNSVSSLLNKLFEVTKFLGENRQELVTRCKEQSIRFTWEKTYDLLVNILLERG